MSLFTRIRDFAEGTVTNLMGGSAIFGTVGGIIRAPGALGRLEDQVGGAVLMLGGKAVLADAPALAQNATQIAGAIKRHDDQLKADAAHNRAIAQQRQMGESQAQYLARLRRDFPAAPVQRTLPAARRVPLSLTIRR